MSDLVSAIITSQGERQTIASGTELLPDRMLSPSLAVQPEGSTAYEVKFLLDEVEAKAVESWAAEHLRPDPHGDPAMNGRYRVTTLYTDTPDLDVFHQTPRYRRRKYRLRRYGDETTIHLERKTRRGERVAKRRTSIPQTELQLLNQAVASKEWSAEWFHSSLLKKLLLPTCQLAYHRTAFFGGDSVNPLRLTLDRHIRGQLTSEWTVETSHRAMPLLTDKVILELKFRDTMPLQFKQLVQDRQLNSTGVSKYRSCLALWIEATMLGESGVQHA